MSRRLNRDRHRWEQDPVGRSIREIVDAFHPHGWIGSLAILASVVVFAISMDTMRSIGPGQAFGLYFSGLGIIVLLSILVLIVLSVPKSESEGVGWYKPFVWSSFSALTVSSIIWLAVFQSLTATGPGRHDQAPKPLELRQAPTSLRLFNPTVERATGTVVLNGVDTSRPSIPFQFDWGDGTASVGWFPQTKVYRKSGTYGIRVTATYQDRSHAFATVTVRVRPRGN